MDSEIVPSALRERLGGDASDALLELLESVRADLREDVINAGSERFERRLVEEVSAIRVQVAQTESSIRQDLFRLDATIHQDLARMDSAIRQDMTRMGAELREAMASMDSAIRQDMTRMGAELREAMASMRTDLLDRMSSDRFDLLKWAFLFWIGQVAAIATMVGIMLRSAGR